MSKAIIAFGYNKYVLSIEDAITIVELMSNAERYASKYKGTEQGGTTYHVWDDDDIAPKEFQVLSDNLYRMAKLAGKSE